MAKITNIHAREILDSRGNPTVETQVDLDDGTMSYASAPSGVQIGTYEALELRDNDPSRRMGMGVLKAVENVNSLIRQKLIGLEPTEQKQIDELLLTLDGTKNKSNLGANTLISVSLAVAYAGAKSQKLRLYKYLNNLAKSYHFPEREMAIPSPVFNMVNGGKHGYGNLDFQEFHVIPNKNKTFAEALSVGIEIYQHLGKLLTERRAVHSVGDEGGFAPDLYTNKEAFKFISEAARNTEYKIKDDFMYGLDLMAGSFMVDGKYQIKDNPNPITSLELMGYLEKINEEFPLAFLEDALTENDWEGWQKLTEKFSPKMVVVGDDFLATNKLLLAQAIEKKACSGILVKPNQAGTLSETFEIIKMAQDAGFKVTISHRLGETTDSFIADLAVAVNADYVKFGAPVRGERVAKYNRLLQIEATLKS
jgi:enolase